MADKEIKIKVSTEADVSNLEDLSGIIDDIKGKADDTGEALQSAFEDATARVEELTEELAGIEMGDVEGDFDAVESELAEATEEAERLKEALEEINDTEVSPKVNSDDVDDLNNKAEETSSAMDSITTAAVGIGASAGLEEMISTADRINTSWNQLDLTFRGTGVSMDTLKTKSTDLSNATGRSGGIIRDYFNQMGIAGVTNANLLSESFEALSGRSYQTGNSIESMETKIQTMVLTGNAGTKMLRGLGLSAEDLAASMGVSADQVSDAFKNMTPEERLQAITKAMGDGAEANEMYKNSYAGLKAQAETAMAGLMGAVGQAILPFVIPALQAATSAVKWLTDGFKSLPGPVQSIIGGIGGFAAVALTAVGVLGTVGQIVKGVKGGLEALNLVTRLSEVYTKAAAAAQWLLNLAMDANPIMIVVLAIIALIAVLVYLYYNNEQVRAAIDALGQTFVYVGQLMYTAIVEAVDWIITSLQGLYDYVMSVGGLLSTNVELTGNSIMDSVLRVILFIATMPGRIMVTLVNVLANVLGFRGNFVNYMIQAGSNAVNNFMSWITSLPGRLRSELNSMLSAVSEWASTLPQKFWDAGVNAVKNFLDALGIHSPGYMQLALLGEMEDTGKRIPSASKEMLTNISDVGKDITSNFGTNHLNDITFNDMASPNKAGGDIIINVYGDIDNDDRIRKLVDAVKHDLFWDNTTAGRTI